MRSLAVLLALAAGALAAIPAVAGATPRARAAIVGGERADPAAVPWYAFFEVCGGTLVAPDRVVTAAHCVEDLTTRAIPPVVVGPARERRRVVRVAQHPAWVRAHRRGGLFAPAHDAALLQLSSPVSAAPLALATADLLAPGTETVVFGRGVRHPASYPDRPPALRAARQVILDDAACGAFYGARGDREVRRAFDPAVMLCARDPRPGTPERRRSAACLGDSGGPLTVAGPAGPRLAGIVSWGLRCGTRGDPDVSAEVPALAGFLADADPAWRPSATGRPRIAGTPRAGRTVACVPPPFASPPDRTLTLFAVDGGRRSRYPHSRSGRLRLRASDAGGRIRCEMLAGNAGGRELTAPSRAVAVRR